MNITFFEGHVKTSPEVMELINFGKVLGLGAFLLLLLLLFGFCCCWVFGFFWRGSVHFGLGFFCYCGFVLGFVVCCFGGFCLVSGGVFCLFFFNTCKHKIYII